MFLTTNFDKLLIACAVITISFMSFSTEAISETLTFKNLWKKHPLNNSESAPAKMLKDIEFGGKLVRKGAPSFANQCAIRMGVALREAGVTLSQIGNPRVSWFHKKDDMFVLVAQDLALGLKASKIEGLGQLEKVKDPKNFHNELYGRKGIIFFKDYWRRKGETTNPTGDHIDVWNGYRTTSKWLMEWFSWLGYNENYGKSKEIWFWEVK
ncbi:MAG: type VI secretion system amidase effector protein Tae4 [Methyloligellaceae bacterium]